MESGPLGHWVLNFYLNHSRIRPYVLHDGVEYIDASELLERPGARLFTYSDGIVFFWPEKEGLFMEAHFLKRRGREAKKAIQAAIDQTRGTIIAEAPEFNKASRQMINSLGFRKTGVSGTWVKNGVSYDVFRYQLERQ